MPATGRRGGCRQKHLRPLEFSGNLERDQQSEPAETPGRPGVGKGAVIHPISRFFATLLPLALALSGCDEPRPSPRRPGVVYVVPLGDVPADELARAELAMADLSHREVRRLPPRRLRSTTLTAECRAAAAPITILPAESANAAPTSPVQVSSDQSCPEPIHDAAALLDRLLADVPPDAFRVLGVTTAALATPAHETLIGFARSHERGLVYSTHGQQAYLTEAAHRRRVRHVVGHELGHTFGAMHCTRDCVMRDAMAPAQPDLLAEHACPHHQPQLAEGLRGSIDDPSFLAAVGTERMRLARWDEAIAALDGAVRRAPGDVQWRTALGVALMASGQLIAADEALGEASRRAPGAPQPYYARAALYAAGYAPTRAPAFLEAAVERDGDVVRAHRAAGIFYQDVLEEPQGAIRHYEAHIRYGGRDPQVIARLVYLLAPTTLTFSTGEVIIARFDPERGLMVASVGRRGAW